MLIVMGLWILSITPVQAGAAPACLAETHFSLAQAYASDGDPDRAIEEYKLALSFDTHSALVHTRLALEYIKKGLFAQAMEYCRLALKQDPEFIDAHLTLGGLYASVHQYAQAMIEYNAVLKKDPKNEEVLVYKVQTLIEDQRLRQAENFLRHFLRIHPDSAFALYYLGIVQQKTGQLSQAVQSYEKVIQLRPSFTEAVFALGSLYEQLKAFNKIDLLYMQYYNTTQDISVLRRLSDFYLKRQRYAQAIPYLGMIFQAEPDNFNAQVKLGLVYLQLKDGKHAIQIFKDILQKKPDAEKMHYYLGAAYTLQQQATLALLEWKQVPPTSSLYSEAVLQMSILLKHRGDMNEAKKYLSSLKPHQVSPYLLILQASIEEEGNNTQEAIRILEKGTHDFPNNEKIHYYLGSLYDQSGWREKSIAQMKEILKFNPENVEALNYIGYTWTQQGVRLKEAEQLLRKALKINPKNPYIQDSWGWYLYMRGRLKEAIIELEKAVRLKPDEPAILEHLGDAYLRSRFKHKAITQYEEGVRSTSDVHMRKKLETKIKNIEHTWQAIRFSEQGVIPVELQVRGPAAQSITE